MTPTLALLGIVMAFIFTVRELGLKLNTDLADCIEVEAIPDTSLSFRVRERKYKAFSWIPNPLARSVDTYDVINKSSDTSDSTKPSKPDDEDEFDLLQNL